MEAFDWSRIFINGLSWPFLIEVVVRTVIMYLVMLLIFRFMGKRQLNQFTVFETVLILALGTVVSTPMFKETEAILPAITALITITGLYYLINWISLSSHKIEHRLEGQTYCIFRDGKINKNRLSDENLSNNEIFSKLRHKHVEHLGQVWRIYLEFSGNISVYFFEDKDVKPGLDILPENINNSYKTIPEDGQHACIVCGNASFFKRGQTFCCASCNADEAAHTSDKKRVA